MPMMMPRVVSTERILLARMASQAMSKPFFDFDEEIHGAAHVLLAASSLAISPSRMRMMRRA